MSEHLNRLMNDIESMNIVKENIGDINKLFADIREWREKNENV